MVPGDNAHYGRKLHAKAVIEKVTPRPRVSAVARRSESEMTRAAYSLQRQMAIERVASSAGSEALAPVRIITLEHGEHRDSTLYRFEKGHRVQFCPGASLMGRKVFLYTNYVLADDGECARGEGEGRARSGWGARVTRTLIAGDDAEFVRNQYYGLEWRAAAAEGEDGERATLGAGVLVTDTDLCCELSARRAGSFHYYFCYDNA